MSAIAAALLVLIGTVLAVPASDGASTTDSYQPESSSALLNIASDADGSRQCVATAVDGTTLVTAAHCVFDRQPEQVQLVGRGGPMEAEVISIHGTEQFSTLTGADDWAWLVTDPHGLTPLSVEDVAQSSDTGVSFSLTEPGAGESVVLRAIEWQILGKCEHPTLESHYICAMPVSGAGACQGDSGTPLLIGIETGRPIVAGVLSHSLGPDDVGTCSTSHSVFALPSDVPPPDVDAESPMASWWLALAGALGISLGGVLMQRRRRRSLAPVVTRHG